MLLTTICYIVKDREVLMLHRIKKENDMNANKWIGVGGKVEEGESPKECIIRETFEETGLTLKNPILKSVVTFNFAKYDNELMFVYIAKEFEGDIKECNEGVLKWIPINKLDELEMWEGDRYFLNSIFDNDVVQELKLVYDMENRLISHE